MGLSYYVLTTILTTRNGLKTQIGFFSPNLRAYLPAALLLMFSQPRTSSRSNSMPSGQALRRVAPLTLCFSSFSRSLAPSLPSHYDMGPVCARQLGALTTPGAYLSEWLPFTVLVQSLLNSHPNLTPPGLILRW